MAGCVAHSAQNFGITNVASLEMLAHHTLALNGVGIRGRQEKKRHHEQDRCHNRIIEK
jgi:hypothetical protein